ncbi:response regulator PleD [bacterium BMS3Bbin06]|nr:response regulator PleD [bacterium BMS3Bbin06]HDO35498.1 response regulator [Nitrospirota bacterium]
MVVICPKCKVRLKIHDEKISPDGSRFCCPKCDTVLLVKRPSARRKEINKRLIMVAHSDDSFIERALNILKGEGFEVITSKDGIDAMVKSMKELPFLMIIDVALPKIYGFEVSKRIKERAETRDIKVILITSVYDQRRYKRPPSTLYGADDYIEEPDLEDLLLAKIRALTEGGRVEKETAEEHPPQPEEKAVTEKAAPHAAGVERARRLARTVLSDLYLYNPRKAAEAIADGNFREVFQVQLSEGFKLYQMRIPSEIRTQGDFFNEEIERFIERKKKETGK